MRHKIVDIERTTGVFMAAPVNPINYEMRGIIIVLFIIYFPASFVKAQIDSNWKEITLCDSSVSVKVPEYWNVKSPYQVFANDQLIYNVKVSCPKRNTYLTADVYDSSYMYNFTIDDFLLENYREAHVKTVGRLDSVGKEVVSINGINVAMLRYVCYDEKNIPRYGIIVLFKKNSQHFYELKLFFGSLQVIEGKALVERIIGSLRLK
ncbi:hypothetical protein HNQ91_004306 [Filimonas zeae]|uniref:Uncharacterized protein n=1 Tax=Filimonas zeae TaxID=1737353 RepID=A0A917MXS0_9BACT|nr:hypothetical protein [Filimonas zeae]MDR6341233.1 hypothetical protein [Filimonas zeae]GGH76695.1 hypothetical protein GCM10011379_41920 [Filimonas zeae]